MEFFFVAGNMSHAEIETPKNDASVGGIINIYDDDLTYVPPMSSGIYLKGDVRHIKEINIAGQSHWLVANNDGEIEIISRRPKANTGD